MTTVLETLQGGAKYLQGKGVADARLNMEHLLAKVLGCGRIDLYMKFDRPMEEAELVPLRELLRKRGEREPLQHLLGEVEFLGRNFISDGRGLIPRPETEELVGMLTTRFTEGEPPARVADVGCGSGVIGLSLAAEWPEAEVTLIDVSPEALQLAGENAAKLEIERESLKLQQGDLLRYCASEFDLVVANLPYIAPEEIAGLQAELAFDPKLALDGGAGGIELIQRLITESAERLAPGGLLALEIGEGQDPELLEQLNAAGFVDAHCVKDLSGVPRFILALRQI